jgi:hypothetical protein
LPGAIEVPLVGGKEKGITKRHGGSRWKLEGEREGLPLFLVFLKLMLTYGKGRTW